MARIYNKALTAEELKAQSSKTPAILSNDKSVLLWLDYADEHTKAQANGWDYDGTRKCSTRIYMQMKLRVIRDGYGGDWEMFQMTTVSVKTV